MGFPGGSDGKESTCNARNLGLILVLDDPLEEGMTTHSNILTWTIPMNREAWWATAYGTTESDTT